MASLASGGVRIPTVGGEQIHQTLSEIIAVRYFDMSALILGSLYFFHIHIFF